MLIKCDLGFPGCLTAMTPRSVSDSWHFLSVSRAGSAGRTNASRPEWAIGSFPATRPPPTSARRLDTISRMPPVRGRGTWPVFGMVFARPRARPLISAARAVWPERPRPDWRLAPTWPASPRSPGEDRIAPGRDPGFGSAPVGGGFVLLHNAGRDAAAAADGDALL